MTFYDKEMRPHENVPAAILTSEARPVNTVAVCLPEDPEAFRTAGVQLGILCRLMLDQRPPPCFYSLMQGVAKGEARFTPYRGGEEPSMIVTLPHLTGEERDRIIEGSFKKLGWEVLLVYCSPLDYAEMASRAEAMKKVGLRH